MSDLPKPIGHNNPPVIAPTADEMLADLEKRFPELQAEYDQFVADLKTYPTEFKYPDDIDQAQALQDLLAKMKKHKTILAAHKKTEKAPWDKLVKVVQNFFAKRDENLDALMEPWAKRHSDFLDAKKAAELAKAEAAAEAARQAEAEAREQTRIAEEKAAAARAEQAAAEAAAAKAREEAEQAERDRKAAAEAAAAKEAEARRLAEDKAMRDRVERGNNAANLASIRRYMKDFERLNDLAEDDKATDDQISQLEQLVKAGGLVSNLATPVAASLLLDGLQVQELDDLKARLTAVRAQMVERADKRSRKRLAREQAEQDERDRQARIQRQRDAEARQAELDKAAADAAAAKAEAEAAKAKQAEAREGIADAQDVLRQTSAGVRDADRGVKVASKEATRAENEASRLEKKVENTSEAEMSRLRGDLGSTASRTGHWVQHIEDFEALRAVCGPLGGDLLDDALNGAVYRYMGARRLSWQGERVELPELPGVVFRWELFTRNA